MKTEQVYTLVVGVVLGAAAMVGYQAYAATESPCDKYEQLTAPLSETLVNRLVLGGDGPDGYDSMDSYQVRQLFNECRTS